MARAKILLVTMFMLSLFLMCGGCVRVEREQQDNNGWRVRQLEQEQSEQERSDQHRYKNSEPHEERSEERHEEQH